MNIRPPRGSDPLTLFPPRAPNDCILNLMIELFDPPIPAPIQRMLRRRLTQMKTRCRHHPMYQGIPVHPPWSKRPRTFIEWAVHNGFQPGLTIDRIHNDKGYTPDNCRWVTPAENNQNKLHRQCDMS